MRKPKAPKAGNAFAKIRNSLQSLEKVIDFDGIDSLTGKFTGRSRKKPNGTIKLFTKFTFEDDILKDAGFKKPIKFRDNVTNTPFGDGVNPRTSGRGSKKFDFLDNGEKIVELSVEPKFLKAFEQGKKMKGLFRVSLDDDFITLSTAKKGQSFADFLVAKADFETGLLG